jgi:hypothetical protein
MGSRFGLGAVVLSLATVFALAAGGCGRADNKGGDAKAKPKPARSDGDAAQVAEKKDHDHGGWWCDEHGVPEDECSMCSAKVAAEMKKHGDWCKEHDRAKSQCFVCDPSLKEKYAARYRAKYGKEPPEPTDNMPTKKSDQNEEKKG